MDEEHGRILEAFAMWFYRSMQRITSMVLKKTKTITRTSHRNHTGRQTYIDMLKSRKVRYRGLSSKYWFDKFKGKYTTKQESRIGIKEHTNEYIFRAEVNC